MPSPIVRLPGAFAAGSTFPVNGQIVDGTLNGIPATNLVSLTLSIVDVLTMAIINGVQAINILNTNRGTVDNQGNLTIQLEVGDTLMDEVPGATSIVRALIIDWSTLTLVGRQQIEFVLLALAGP